MMKTPTKQKAFPKTHTSGSAIGFSLLRSLRIPALNELAKSAPTKTATDARVVYSMFLSLNT